MPLAPGAKIGGYDVVALLGAGGMGEVYRARDARLGRDVAIKIVSPRIASDTAGLARFEREARALASLNHPNIAAIYGVEDTAGQPALILELVDGETLADRIARGRMPAGEALTIARQIADALDTAHEGGIVHRDLKPANIKITEDGRVKVLDFGLAKAVAAATHDPAIDPSQSPTVTIEGTQRGVILGTAAYMSPEQARGKAIDKRTDIWAFGCVLYEMLSGRRAFDGDTTSDLIAAILERAPDYSKLPAAVPPHVRRVIERCLEKDPKRRARDIADVRTELETARDAAAPSRRLPMLGWIVSGVTAAVIAGVLIARPQAPALEAPLVRSTLNVPGPYRLAVGSSDYPLAISRDGTRIAFVGEHHDQRRLFVRTLGDEIARELPGTEGALHPFFSPDGAWIGYFIRSDVQKVAYTGGAPLRLGNTGGETLGGAWGDDVIVFARRGRGLSRISDSGGAAAQIDGADTGAWPFMLDNGRTILYLTGRAGAGAIATIDVDGKNKRIIASTNEYGEGPTVLGTGGNLAQVQLSSRFLVFGQSPDVVRALPVDPITLVPTGSVMSIVSGIERARNGGGVYFAVSRTGTMLYARTGDRHSLVWVDRRGLETPVTAERQAYRLPVISPDGRRIAVAINDQTRRSQLWLYDETGQRIRLTTEGHSLRPVWSPDGTRIAFSAAGVDVVTINGLRRDTLFPRALFSEPWPVGTNPYPTAWSRDGGTLLMQADSLDIWAGSLEDRKVRPVLARDAVDSESTLSPDGQWLAYQSDEFGRMEVCVRRYPSLDDVTVISTGGGAYPQWSGDGKELFFKEGDTMMAARLAFEPRPRVIARERLFSGDYVGTGREIGFDVTADGRRFVMVKSDPASALKELTLVQNWTGLLNRTPD